MERTTAQRGPTKSELLSRAVQHGALKDAAAELTKTPELLEWVATESHSERRRLLEDDRSAEDGAILDSIEPA